MKLLTYNVNGIRSAMSKGLVEWLADTQADILCLQEVKAEMAQVDLAPFRALGYEVYWHAAQKKGYSGVAVFTKIAPNSVTYGMGNEIYDQEGRVLQLHFNDFTLINTYFPSGTSGDERQDFKYRWLDDFKKFVATQFGPNPSLIICGDLNICHKPIDIHNPVANKNSTGFLPEEREWVTQFLADGFTDCFRYFSPEIPHQYTWWSFRAGARKKNLGWRIDYFLASASLNNRLASCLILPEAAHSDHCPIELQLNA